MWTIISKAGATKKTTHIYYYIHIHIYIPILTYIKKNYKVIKITHEQYLTQNVNNGETQQQKGRHEDK